MRWFFAWLGPHTGDPVRCADGFTVINMLEDILKGSVLNFDFFKKLMPSGLTAFI